LRRVLTIMAAVGFLAAAAAPAQAALVQEAPASSWQTDGKVNAIVIANGRIYIGGSFTHVRGPGVPGPGGTVRNHLAAFNATTGALMGWNPNANGIVNALAIRPNHKTIYAGGHFTQVHGSARGHVAAINATTGALRPWKANTNGKVDVIKATNARVYIGGEFTILKGKTRHRLGAVGTTSAARLLAWKANASSAVFALALSGDGKRLYVGGAFDHMNGKKANHLSAVKTSTGAIAKKFRVHPAWTVFALQLAGNSIYVGGAGNGGHVNAYRIADNHRRWLALTDGDVRALTLRQNVVYVGGHFNNYCQGGTGSGTPLTCNSNTGRPKFLALNESSGHLTTWNPIGNSVQGAFAIRSSKTQVVAGGSFDHIHGQAQEGFVRWTP
jgi:hypothetical protein